MASSAHGQLSAGQVTTVRIDAGYAGIEVVNRDQSAEMWVRLDGQDPVVGAPDSFVVLGARAFTTGRRAVTVTLVSDQALHYSVEAA